MRRTHQVLALTLALGVAAGLHEFYRQSDLIQMAHYAQTVNVIGARRAFALLAGAVASTPVLIQAMNQAKSQAKTSVFFMSVRCVGGNPS